MVLCKIHIRIIPFNNGIIIRFQLKSMKKRKMKLKRIMIMMDTDSNDRYWIIEKKRKQIEKLASRGRGGFKIIQNSPFGFFLLGRIFFYFCKKCCCYIDFSLSFYV